MDDTNTTSAKWCRLDNHHHYEHFEDFNEWIDSGDGHAASPLLQNLLNSGLPNLSKAFYASDREAYEQAFNRFQLERSNEVLSKDRFVENMGDTDGLHWHERNTQRFTQLIYCLQHESVVPFVGAGVSVTGGFPSWAEHLCQQARTAGIDPTAVDAWIENGEYEEIIDHVEQTRGRDTFAQEIRDVFGRIGRLESITLQIAELFADTLITTNYDSLLEQVFDTDTPRPVEVINGNDAMQRPDATKTTIIKLHGDAKSPGKCILGKAHYDDAYGQTALNQHKAIPKLLKYYFSNNHLLFIGCSLHNDRTLQVFKAVKAANSEFNFPQHFAIVQAPEDHDAMARRNADLLALGITAIWYPEGDHDKVESILRHARNELARTRANL
ncbi:MAG: SIR2 family protein [Granulosicoccus sp.]